MATCFPMSLLIVLLWSPFGQEPGTVKFAPGFPFAIPRTGSALVMGTTRPSPGFQLGAVKVVYWIGGGVANTSRVTVRPEGGFGSVIRGLRVGTTYFVMIEVVQIRGDKKEVLANVGKVIAR